jgi:acetyl/propionyl-CoA carboxylase alpha subunit/acetyl-CoA carboxylase carboxyltransferase component
MKKLLVANRGEIAVRIMHAAAELGLRTVAVSSADDVDALHTLRADEVHSLRGAGAPAYLDTEQIVSIAREHACDCIHPGYGFLSESAAFARRCMAAGITFVGPRVETLEVLGNKGRALALARSCRVPVLKGTTEAVSVSQASEFFASLDEGAAMVIKAIAGGGGRGMRVVDHQDQIAEAYARCQSEARQSFGNPDVYVEQHMPRARHVEVQIVGDSSGAVSHLGERECSIQRRYQKLVEIAPCPGLPADLRARITGDAVRMAKKVHFQNLGTFEFLIDAESIASPFPPRKSSGRSGARSARRIPSYAFIESNPRLQVEHTVTEEVWGLDLVRIQLQLAAGSSLEELGLAQRALPAPRGFALQLRINTETVQPDGSTRPASGTVTAFELPTGHGMRTDTAAHVGFRTNPHFDSLLAKLIAHSNSPRFTDVVARAARALGEFRIEGVRTNLPFLRRLLQHPDFIANHLHTTFVAEHMPELAVEQDAGYAMLSRERAEPPSLTGARIDSTDPLAVLKHGKSTDTTSARGRPGAYADPSSQSGNRDAESGAYATGSLEGAFIMRAPMQGTIVTIDVSVGEEVRPGDPLLVMNAMKMEHVITATIGGLIRRITVSEGATVPEAYPLAFIEPAEVEPPEAEATTQIDLERERPDLAEVHRRHAITLDAARPNAVERRRQAGQRTARENIADLCDPDSFVEYGALQLAAQRQRRSLEDLIERTPADGLVAGVGKINGHLFDEARSRCIVMAYDYTVLAGTQGFQNHRKKDRMFELAERLRFPVVFFTEGGGGRPGDTDAPGVAGLDCMAFHLFGRLSGLVPLVGINSGRCFAGNAAILGCCDVVIASGNSNIGMGGPAMIEGGGLGVFRPEEVGPMSVQVANGVVDIAVSDEAEAVSAARRYLSYFQGTTSPWECPDQRQLRAVIPENRLRVYEVRRVIETLADTGSVLELRRGFGVGMVTALIRIEGRPFGVIANNPKHLAGAIDSAGADKAARFMQLCDAFDIPILLLCDTPGMMVGPEVEKTALVRHCCRMFVIGSTLSVPCFTIVLRKGYGLGAQAMAGGSFKAPLFTVSWPTGEFGGMGLEGAVKLGFRKELAAIEDPEERRRLFEQMVARAYERGGALNTASHFEIDDVIDPAESRRWILSLLGSFAPPAPRSHKKRPCIDTW